MTRATPTQHALQVTEVAAQLRTVVAEIECLKTDSIEEVLDVDDVIKLAAELTKGSAPIVPKKHLGALQRGRKLTRAGLLFRSELPSSRAGNRQLESLWRTGLR
jgi:hypothetical protein